MAFTPQPRGILNNGHTTDKDREEQICRVTSTEIAFCFIRGKLENINNITCTNRDDFKNTPLWYERGINPFISNISMVILPIVGRTFLIV